MSNINIEIKAKCSDREEIKKILASTKAIFKGTDKQVDSYFNVNNGRLKLREGNIENALIHYNRDDKETPKQSEYTLYKSHSNKLLKELLTRALGLLVVVEKERDIYFIDNVKFHLDEVKGLGTFVEIEAIANENEFECDADVDENEKLMEQCKYYLKLFRIKNEDLIPYSYSDLLLNKKETLPC